MAGFGTPPEDMKNIYILFIRSLLEQSATVWHSSISLENAEDLERVQKSALKVILQDQYKGYKNALNRLDLESLHDRRENLCLNFAIKCTQKKLENVFPKNSKQHEMITRNPEVYKVQFANTERLKNSPIIYMQELLNENEKIMHTSKI